MKKHEALELDSKTRESELAAALESAKSAKAEAQKALQEIQAAKKIAAGKAFIMQSKHVKETFLLLTRVSLTFVLFELPLGKAELFLGPLKVPLQCGDLRSTCGSG